MSQAQWNVARRDLALLSAETLGVQTAVGQFGGAINMKRAERRRLRDYVDSHCELTMLIDPRPGLHVLDMNHAYADATLTRREAAAGEKLFELFPDNPDLPSANGVTNLFSSLQQAAQSGMPHAMASQRYDVRGADGSFVVKHWLPVNNPIFDEDGRLIYILHTVRQMD